MKYKVLLRIRYSVMRLQHLQFVLQCFVLWDISEQRGVLITGRDKLSGQARISNAFHISARGDTQECCPLLGLLCDCVSLSMEKD